LGDHLGEKNQPTDLAVCLSPRQTFPLQPALISFSVVIRLFILTLHSARKYSAMRFFPTLWEIWKHVILKSANNVLPVELVVSKKTIAYLQVAHLGVEHRDCRRRVLYE